MVRQPGRAFRAPTPDGRSALVPETGRASGQRSGKQRLGVGGRLSGQPPKLPG
jgi:hypothetical protein